MSNEFAIAAVTITMRNLLEGVRVLKDNEEVRNQLPDDLKPNNIIEIINLPLDAAYGEENKKKNYVNLFLYHVEHSADWRNRDIPGSVKPGESGHTPLALRLLYIITAHGENDDELIGHLLLGKAMSILHDHSLLGRNEIKTAFESSELHKQVERLRITPIPISLDEVSKLWTGFQTQYRLSAAYEVSVVLIESKRPARTPLPVLTRGPGDKGIAAQPSLIPPYPALESLSYPGNQTGALPGDLLILSGHHLGGDTVTVRFTHPQLSASNEVPVLPGDGTETKITVTIPNVPADWPAGFYKAAVFIIKAGEQDRTTNEIPFMLVPSIHHSTIDIAPMAPPGGGNYRATISFSPQVLPDQKASLLLGGREFPADSHSTQTDELTFLLTDVSPGEYYVRLRIDGVDSPLIDHSEEPPVFDENYKVMIP
ncbi:MAG: DUF4255 domain-containing protein [Candidatus Aminicenantes bacterium]|jgi:hypothetical protein